MIVNFITQIQDKSHSGALKKQSSISSSAGGVQSSCSSTVYRHRRNSSSCSIGPTSSYMLCKNTTSTASASSCVASGSQRRQSPSPTARRCDMVVQQRVRAESSERPGKRNIREKMVDFDFSHHKSTENFQVHDTTLHTTTAAVHRSHIPIPTTTISGSAGAPSKSCFKHHQATQVTCSTATPSRTACSTAFSAASPSSKFGVTSSGCRQCGHSKCTRAQSLEKEDRERKLGFLRTLHPQLNPGRSLSACSSTHIQRGSCSNLTRQHSTESYGSRDERSSLMGSTHRISLYDAHKLNQAMTAAQQEQQHSQPSTRRHKDPLKRLRDCVLYADVFLEAMGNASTLKNNNSSRYVS